MKKNLFLKILAMTLAAMLVIGSAGVAALAEEINPDQDGNIIVYESGTYEYTGNVEGQVGAYAEEDVNIGLTITGSVTVPEEDLAPAVFAEAEDSGKTTVVTGDVNGSGNDAVIVKALDGGTVTAELGNIDLDTDVSNSALRVYTSGEKSMATVTAGAVTSDAKGVYIENAGGTVELTSGTVDAGIMGAQIYQGGGYKYSSQNISKDEFDSFVTGEPVYATIDTYGDQIFNKDEFYIGTDGKKYEKRQDFGGYTGYYRLDDTTYTANTNVTINGNITVKETGEVSYPSVSGISASHYGDGEGTLTLDLNGNVSVEAKNGATGVYMNDVNATIDGDIKVKGQSVNGVTISNSATTTSEQIINGDITVDGQMAYGFTVNNGQATIVGDVTVKGEESATGATVSTPSSAGGKTTATFTGDLTVSGENPTGVDMQAGLYYGGIIVKPDAPQMVRETIGDRSKIFEDEKEEDPVVHYESTGTISADGKNAKAIEAKNSDGVVEATITGNVNASGEDSIGIRTLNEGGENNIIVTGNVTSEGTGLSLNDTAYPYRVAYDDSENPIVYDEKDEYAGKQWFHGSEQDVYIHKEGDKEVYYTIYEIDEIIWDQETGSYKTDGNGKPLTEKKVYVYDKWTVEEPAEDAMTPGEGSTRVEVIGDVTATETGIAVDLTNDEGTMDVIVDGTVSGKTQSILVSEETISDNLSLTIWEVKANTAGNLVERETADGKTEADKKLEQKIQYIIKIEPSQTDIISTDAKDYEGYKVAKEGETVTLKLNVPKGYRVANAFNGTDTKVQLAQDAAGNYYLIVPRGGAVMLSVDLELLPAPSKKTTTTEKVAVMKPAEDTAETKAFKELIENGDIMEILPEEIKELLPEGINAVDEAVTLTLENYEESMGAVTLKIAVKKTYAKGEKATVVIALPDGNGGYTYFYIEGEGEEDGTLSLNIPAETAKALAGKTFVTMILK